MSRHTPSYPPHMRHHTHSGSDISEIDLNEKADDVLNNFAVREGRDGKYRFLGFEVHPALAEILNFGHRMFIAPAAKYVGKQTYQHTKRVSQDWLKRSPHTSHKIAQGAEIAVGVGLLAVDPVMTVVSAGWDYSKERNRIYEEFKPVIENTGTKAATNEVIKVELAHARQGMWDNVKGIIPKIPGLIYEGLYFGYGIKHSQKQRSYEESSEFKHLLEDKQKEYMQSVERRHELREDPFDSAEALKHYKDYEEASDRAELLKDWQNKYSTKNNSWLHWLLIDKGDSTTMGVGALTRAGERYLESKALDDERREHPRAWQLIQRLHEQLEERRTAHHHADIVGLSNIDARDLQDDIKAIFLQHELDAGYGKLSGANTLRALDEASLVIAEAIADGRLHEFGLVNLVGDKMVISSDAKGLHKVASKHELKDKLEKLQVTMGACTVPSIEEFYAHFESADGMKAQLKDYLAKMPEGIEKDCFIALFSYDVLQEAGIDKEHAIAAHRRAEGHISSVVENSFKDIASKSEKELHKYNLTDNDLRALEQIAATMENGDREERQKLIDSLINGQAHTLLQNIIGVTALQELQTDNRAWTKRMKARPPQQRREESEDWREHAQSGRGNRYNPEDLAQGSDGVSEGAGYLKDENDNEPAFTDEREGEGYAGRVGRAKPLVPIGRYMKKTHSSAFLPKG